MKLLITPEWLRGKIESDPDMDTEAGLPSEALKTISMFLPQQSNEQQIDENVHDLNLKQAFGTFARNLRLLKNMTFESLAERASVEVDELVSIETDPHYQARPRTVIQLASFYNIEANRMMQLCGATHYHDDVFEEEALKFAAKSRGVSSLNADEQKVLNEFVKYLNEE